MDRCLTLTARKESRRQHSFCNGGRARWREWNQGERRMGMKREGVAADTTTGGQAQGHRWLRTLLQACEGENTPPPTSVLKSGRMRTIESCVWKFQDVLKRLKMRIKKALSTGIPDLSPETHTLLSGLRVLGRLKGSWRTSRRSHPQLQVQR